MVAPGDWKCRYVQALRPNAYKFDCCRAPLRYRWPYPRQWRGVYATPHEFFWAGCYTIWSIVLNFSIAYEASLPQLLVKKIIRWRHVTKLWRHKRNNLRQDFSEIVSKRNLAWCEVRLTWMGIVDMIGVNIGLSVTLDLVSCEFQGQLRSPKVTDLCWPHNDQ